jgi:parallel beta-helix repeat protein
MIGSSYARRTRLVLRLVCALAAVACGDDASPGEADAGGGGDGGGDGGERYAGCSHVIEAGEGTEAIQTALIEAKTGDTLCFADGTYQIENELSLTVNNVTLRGNPSDRERVVLDYTNQSEGKDALSVSSADFTIEHLTIRNSNGNSIVVKGAERPTFRNLKVYWDAGSKTENGAYAVYPLGCTDVLIEDCEVIGASDAGIYVGQSKRIIVRNNLVHGNVAGIEIENSDDALVTGNRAYDNTCGILVFVMPNLEKKDGHGTIVEDNVVEDNNRANFGEAGTTVASVPAGTGILTLANDGTEVRDNQIRRNDSTGVLAISFSTYAALCLLDGSDGCGAADPGTDPDASKTFIHDNTFADNGTAPDEGVATVFPGVDPIPNVLWDGRKPADAVDEDQFCLGPNPSDVRVFGDQDGLNLLNGKPDVTDASLFTCELPAPFAALELPQDD